MTATSRRPDFVVIGAGKSGTTSLFRYLAEHPEIGMSRVKATNYFVADWLRSRLEGPGDTGRVGLPCTDWESYLGMFGANEHAAAGEVSPLYMYVPGTARRLAESLPALRVVAILRDPVEAAYSYYKMLRALGLEDVDDFDQALRREDDRVERRWSPAWHYTRRGFYHRQLQPFFEHFPAARLKILLFDDLKRDASAVMRELYAFLGVDPCFEPDVATRHNVSGSSGRPPGLLGRWRARRRRFPPLTAPTRTRLRETFRADLLELRELIGRDLGAWGVGDGAVAG